MEVQHPYCKFVATLPEDNVHKIYHDQAYGFPIETDQELFCRLVLEINQAGLSWETILKKEQTFRAAYHNFDIERVANYQYADVERLLSDPGIIRNRLKVAAAIHNAKIILELQKEFGSFRDWLEMNHPKTKAEWVKLFKKHFKFTGGEIVNEFLMSAGYLAGAHGISCKIYQEVLTSKPKWAEHINSEI